MNREGQAENTEQAAIEVCSVSKAFGPRLVLRGVRLVVRRSEGVCLCGINGAGKSTLLRIIAGLLCPDTGTVRLNGHDVRAEAAKTKPQLGVIGHKSMVYPELTVWENLSFFARLYGVSDRAARVTGFLEKLGLARYRYDKAGVLSRGLLQRLAIARALVHGPRVLLADEPFTGLDLEACRYLVSVFTDFRNEGGAIVMTTHDISVGLECCDRVAVLDSRAVIFDSTTDKIDKSAFLMDYLSYARSSD